ncbi:hypothetical protein GCM10010916_14610 [Paenibacillus abyssi]|uniref:Uncharacterized protein n=2 Tax=Paenibacillus abyssi TaxID=1340531 RepID=A0A917FPX3_9BACL|nr:hypothetical protein GCM10010916_14610 [Paenibacillus abyssi]
MSAQAPDPGDWPENNPKRSLRFRRFAIAKNYRIEECIAWHAVQEYDGAKGGVRYGWEVHRFI